jgi:hypothetical protein
VLDIIGMPGPEPKRQGGITELDRPLVDLLVPTRRSATGERLKVLACGVEAELGGELEDVRCPDLERRLHPLPVGSGYLNIVAGREALIAFPARRPLEPDHLPGRLVLSARRLDGAAHADVVGAAGEQLVGVGDQRDRSGDLVDVAT